MLIIIFIPWLTNLEAVFRDKYDYPVNWKLANELSDYANNNFAQDKVNFITGGSLAFYNYFTHDLINIQPISTKQDYAEKIFPNYNLVKNINKSLCASEVVLISNLETQSRYPGNWQVLKSSFKFSKIKEFFSGNLLIYKLEKLPNIACKTTK